MMDQIALEVKQLQMHFSGLKAVNQVSFVLAKNQIKAMIGPNGAGKTTMFNCISGIYTPTFGEIFLNGQEKISGLKPYQITRKGISRTFQNIRLFKKMSAIENIMTGFHHKTTYGIPGIIFKSQKFKQEEGQIIDKSFELLKTCSLENFAHTEAAQLPYAAQRKLEIARALANSPEILLLDEPAAGMNPKETEELAELILLLKQQFNLSVLLIEHDINFVMNLSDSIIVMDHGEPIADNSPSKVRQNPEVMKAYLGE